ncbi:hypothetical protein CLV99_1426 [Sphingobacterium yanglingense]|uniref:Uncharacterized protein n=1 Tax=Sphingobacterium yanglingense TaxID=1437280 RepID=A0A4R6WMF8_9SPHI|nr:hypothetical protein CLV99_1426 [Sphingobacterium yanglingense]
MLGGEKQEIHLTIRPSLWTEDRPSQLKIQLLILINKILQ